MQKVAADIMMIVIARTPLRPSRSPSGPQKKPPKGRAMKETASVARVSSVSCSPGKKWCPMYVATTA